MISKDFFEKVQKFYDSLANNEKWNVCLKFCHGELCLHLFVHGKELKNIHVEDNSEMERLLNHDPDLVGIILLNRIVKKAYYEIQEKTLYQDLTIQTELVNLKNLVDNYMQY